MLKGKLDAWSGLNTFDSFNILQETWIAENSSILFAKRVKKDAIASFLKILCQTFNLT